MNERIRERGPEKRTGEIGPAGAINERRRVLEERTRERGLEERTRE